MKAIASAAAAGTLFGIGLAIAGMLDPSKVTGFLDFAGNWDPSLAFVMGGGVAVTALLFPRVTKREAPVCEASFNLPTKTAINPELIIGSGMFGIGWGLVGLCPGPAFSVQSFGQWELGLFFAAMVGGVLAFRILHKISGIFVQTVTEDG
ncbi:MAG: YeeE/YedE family protein [Rhodospirillales bacterium]|nr:YeeE/YedE family protein [Rhodospirillales bacterium]